MQPHEILFTLAVFVFLVDVYLRQKEKVEMANTIESLRTAVEKLSTVRASATALVIGLIDELKNLRAELEGKGVDTTAIDNLTARITAETEALAAAVAMGTAAENEVPSTDEQADSQISGSPNPEGDVPVAPTE